MIPRWRDWNIAYTRKGQVKLAMARILKFCMLASVIFCTYKARRSGVDLKGQGQSLFAFIRETSTTLMGMARRVVINKS
jgi:hypothetical protein